MPFCIKCGSKLLTNAKFCHRCGAAVKLIKKPATPFPLSSPYKSPIAETYYEMLRLAVEEKLHPSLRIKHREAPTKPFEKGGKD